MKIKSTLTGALAGALTFVAGCATTDLAPAQTAAQLASAPVVIDFAKRHDLGLSESQPGLYQIQTSLLAGDYQLVINDQRNDQSVTLGVAKKPSIRLRLKNKLASGDQPLSLKIKKDGDYKITVDLRKTPSLRIVPVKKPKPKPKAVSCQVASGELITTDVSSVFADGQQLRDAYSGQQVTVKNGKVSIQPSAKANLVLLEAVDSQPSAFEWDNALVYFVMTDRFENGDPSNDHSYGRKKDGKDEIGTFHGGDLKGLASRLDYLQSLGVNALWITAPYEQIHGFVGGGGRGDFPHYAYHGYYAQDYTKLDANMGSEQDLEALVAEAHRRGIRIVFDVVMNHTGYNTLADMQQFDFGGLREGMQQYLPDNWNDWKPAKGENWHSYHDFIQYRGNKWANWWGAEWIRAGIGGYESGPSVSADPEKGSLAYLPDFKTESTQYVGLPAFYANKPDTNAKPLENATVRDYLTTWLSDWVANYGIDGFRADTVKHVEPESWAQLKQQSDQALDSWRKNNPDKALDDQPFWMVGEYWGHGLNKSRYYENGFDSMINFDFQNDGAVKGMKCLSSLDKTYADYSQKINSDSSFNVLSYISSHDTALFFERHAKKDLQKQQQAASALMLLPGNVQIYYGDESARPAGPLSSDPLQATRSDMNWQQQSEPQRAALLEHWKKLGQFRNKHAAMASGSHKKLTSDGYAFAREKGDDKVVVIWAGNHQ